MGRYEGLGPLEQQHLDVYSKLVVVREFIGIDNILQITLRSGAITAWHMHREKSDHIQTDQIPTVSEHR